MNSGFLESMGKSVFIERYPLWFAFFVFIGVELGTLAVGVNENAEQLLVHPLRALGLMAIKFVVIVLCTYGYLLMIKRGSSREKT
jgi:hypothetical protein